MREKPKDGASFKQKHPCGGYGYAVGLRKSVRVPLDCNRWDCKKCGKVLTQIWMDRINHDLCGSVLYSVSTTKQGKELSEQKRRNIKKTSIYFCAYLDDGAVVFSNANFRGAEARNRKKLVEEIRVLMVSGKVKGMSRRQRQKDADYNTPTKDAPWSFTRITADIKPEYDKCQNEYEIGNLLLKYSGSDKRRRLTKLGKELIRKIEAGEISSLNVGESSK